MSFVFQPTDLDGLVLIKPKIFGDSRGHFLETYKESSFLGFKIAERFVQDNHSFSNCGVVRGINYQKEPFAQEKLVRTIEGVAWDVAVDLRTDSPTYGE